MMKQLSVYIINFLLTPCAQRPLCIRRVPYFRDGK